MTLTVQYLSGALGSYGPVYRDVTRDGDTAHRAIYIGPRGSTTTVTARRHFEKKRDAREYILLVESAQGQTITIHDRLADTDHVVFLHRATPDKIRPIGGHATWNWTVKIELELSRRA